MGRKHELSVLGKKRRTRISPCPEYSLFYTDKSSGKSLMSFNLFPSINAFSISMESSAPVSFTAFTSSYRAKWYMQSMSPVPNANEASLLGSGSPVTTTI